MKNLCFILISAIVCFYFVGCGDNEFDTPEELMKVTKSEVIFNATGGSGSIEVDAPQSISATVDKNWCTLSVSENKIAVSVTENKSIEGRHATVIIASGDETKYVSVTQSGAISDIRIPESARASLDGDRLEYTAKFDFLIDININVDWISHELADNKLILNVSPNDNTRTGVVTISTKYIDGAETKTKIQTLTVNQDILGYKHFLGNWSFSFIDALGGATNRIEIDAVLAQKEGTSDTYTLSGFPVGSTFGSLDISYSLVNGNNIFTITNRQKQPDVKGYDVYAVMINDDATAYNSNASITYQGKYQQSSGKISIAFSDNGSWPEKVIGGLLIAAFNKTNGNYESGFYSMNKIVMTKK